MSEVHHESVPVTLSKIYVSGKIIQVEYVCNICYENPRLKRKHKSHLHGGGSYDAFYRKDIDWSRPYSFGTRVPHCSATYIEYQKPSPIGYKVSDETCELLRKLPEVHLMYDPLQTKVQEHLLQPM